MFRHYSHRRVRILCVVTLAAIVSGCSDDDDPTGPAVDAQLEVLRNATDSFHDVDVALQAGHSVLVTHPTTAARCLQDPAAGGMGFHFLDPSLADSVVSLSNPEVVIYEPLANGQLGLVAVEYLVPFAILPASSEPPTLFGEEFQRNDTFQVWALHAWVWKDNPDGVFANYNPNVSCEHEDDVPAFSTG